MMATLRCDHPDIEIFIDAKRDPEQLRNFNLSVLVSDEFMRAVEDDASWPLLFPVDPLGGMELFSGHEIIHRRWSGMQQAVPCVVLKKLAARELWERIMHATYDMAEPGVLFVDRINQYNNLGYREDISATNPCGEIPLPPYGACNLGSINLTRFVQSPFSPAARVDNAAIAATVRIALRMLNHIIDLSQFPLEAQAEQARGSRRIGLGITGLADMLIMLGLHYADGAARDQAASVMRLIRDTAYRESVALAKTDGVFPFYQREAYSNSAYIKSLPADIQREIYDHGIRNSHLTAIAPAGTISLFANNVSSGIEPIFDFEYQRRIRNVDGVYQVHSATDYAWRLWQRMYPEKALPGYFVNAHSLAPRHHLAMQAALQPYVDSAISKTINVPADFEFNAFKDLYRQAYRLGLKGCTTFRPNEITGAILTGTTEQRLAEPDTGCCSLERESG